MRGIIENPDNLRAGLEGIQAELQDKNQALVARKAIVDTQIQEHEDQLTRLLDLYLEGRFPKDILTDRKVRLEEMLASLRKEQCDLAAHVRSVTLTDDQLGAIEAFCARIRKGLDQADFSAKRQIIELLDVRGKVAFENGEKVLYLKCLVRPQEQQPLLPIAISPSLNTGALATARFVCPPMARSR